MSEQTINLSEYQPILAIYDIRSKQKFIYSSTRIQEIVGASLLIRDCFRDFLKPAADQFGKGIYGFCELDSKIEVSTRQELLPFTEETVRKHLTENGYIGEIVYDGGGNFLVVYRNIKVYQDVNRLFYRNVLRGTGTMRVLTSYVELEQKEGHYFTDYKADSDRLYAVHRIRERKESAFYPVNTLPIVQTDYASSRPVVRYYDRTGKNSSDKVSYETWKKYEKYRNAQADSRNEREIQGTTILDELIEEKGKNSLLAVIYIDGNGMGAQVEKCVAGGQNFEKSVMKLRQFSEKIQKNYIDNRIENLDDQIYEQPSRKKDDKKRRVVIHAGDEITLICKASDAYETARTYLKGLYQEDDGTHKCTSCAGIAIFHSHAPFADAYRIAEECCENGKKRMKNENIANVSLLDFHYCEGTIGISLEAIRAREEMEDISRPWLMEGDEGKKIFTSRATIERLTAELKKIGRSNVKGLAASAKRSQAEFEMEIERIKAHLDVGNREKEPVIVDFSLGGTLSEAEQKKLLYDIVIVYDLWGDSLAAEFAEKGGNL